MDTDTYENDPSKGVWRAWIVMGLQEVESTDLET